MRTGSRSRGGTATAVPPRLLFVPRTPCRSGVTQAERDAGTRTDGRTGDEREELARLRRDNRRLSEDESKSSSTRKLMPARWAG
jgi:transposase